jgi:hypothetical protein
MTLMETTEREGAEAFRAGLPLNSCPYSGEAGEYWADGWWEAWRKKTESELDIIFTNHGSIFLVRGGTKSGREWLDTNLAADAMRWGIFWCVEPRYAAAIAEGADADGLNVGDVA